MGGAARKDFSSLVGWQVAALAAGSALALIFSITPLVFGRYAVARCEGQGVHMMAKCGALELGKWPNAAQVGEWWPNAAHVSRDGQVRGSTFARWPSAGPPPTARVKVPGCGPTSWRRTRCGHRIIMATALGLASSNNNHTPPTHTMRRSSSSHTQVAGHDVKSRGI